MSGNDPLPNPRDLWTQKEFDYFEEKSGNPQRNFVSGIQGMAEACVGLSKAQEKNVKETLLLNLGTCAVIALRGAWFLIRHWNAQK